MIRRPRPRHQRDLLVVLTATASTASKTQVSLAPTLIPPLLRHHHAALRSCRLPTLRSSQCKSGCCVWRSVRPPSWTRFATCCQQPQPSLGLNHPPFPLVMRRRRVSTPQPWLPAVRRFPLSLRRPPPVVRPSPNLSCLEAVMPLRLALPLQPPVLPSKLQGTRRRSPLLTRLLSLQQHRMLQVRRD